jgi:SET domain-containing protein
MESPHRQEESERRLVEMKKIGESNFYLFAVSPSHIIDAGAKGNLARFLNHSCAPNCYSQVRTHTHCFMWGFQIL